MVEGMEIYRILKNSETKLVLPGFILPDGTMRFTDKQNPIVLAGECARLGLDPKKVQASKTPAECLARLGMNPGGVEIILDSTYTQRLRDAVAQKEAALEQSFPGLRRMRELASLASNESHRHQRDFQRMMDDEDNDGARPPRPENRSFAEELADLRRDHPRTALYLRAEKQAQGTSSFSATSGAMKGGQDALALLIAGGSTEAAEAALAFRYPSDGWAD